MQGSGRHRCSDHESDTASSVQMLACKEPRILKINVWSDTLKLIKGSSRVSCVSVSNHAVYFCHNWFKDGKYLVTSPWQAGKECNIELCFYFSWSFLIIYCISPVWFLILWLTLSFIYLLSSFDSTLDCSICITCHMSYHFIIMYCR